MLLVTKLPPLTYKLFDIFTSEDDFSKEMVVFLILELSAFFVNSGSLRGGGGGCMDTSMLVLCTNCRNSDLHLKIKTTSA